MRRSLVASLLAVSFLLAACSGDSSTPADEVPQLSEEPAGFDGDTSTSDNAMAVC
jgi:ABC-type glycerol-3-phosphate transport system substrate-binding protein